MAIPTDSSFGSDFSATEFRNAIFSTMQMGTPNRVEEKLIFSFDGKAEYDVVDSAGVPWDLNATAVSPGTERPDVVAVGSVSHIDRATTGTNLGDFDTPRAVVTMLDEEYLKVEGASAVSIGGDIYDVRYVTVGGLFGVDVFEFQCEARAES